jgi:uncharacterized membrane protein affecting hemolysin expression
MLRNVATNHLEFIMRSVFPLALALFVTPAMAQQVAAPPASPPSLEQQLDSLGMEATQKLLNLINLAKSQDATIKQLMAQTNALTKERDELKASVAPKVEEPKK